MGAMDELVDAMEVLSARAAAEVLDELILAVREGQALSPDQAIALAFVAGVEVGAVGLSGRTEYALKVEDFRKEASGSLIETGRQLANRDIMDLIAQAQDDRD
jgi:hypothetical protein